MTKKELFKILEKKEQKYFDLIWYSRRRWENFAIEGVVERLDEIEALYPEECELLNDPETGQWQNAFNLGMIAALRYAQSLELDGEAVAEEEFPFLDT